MWRVRPPALLVLASALRAVTPLPVGTLLQHPAHYFDLEHRRLRFEPRGPAAYDVTSAPFRGELSRGMPVGVPTDTKGYSWRTSLPFPFPFAGKSWNEVYINLNGGVTFGAPESTEYPERDTWPQGTMRWLASSLDVAAVAGTRPMIPAAMGLELGRGDAHFHARHAQRVLGDMAGSSLPCGSRSLPAPRREHLSGQPGARWLHRIPLRKGRRKRWCHRGLLRAVTRRQGARFIELPTRLPHVPPAVDLRLGFTLTDDGTDLHFSPTLCGAGSDLGQSRRPSGGMP